MDLTSGLIHLLPRLAQDGMLWVPWPRKAAAMATELDGNVVRSTGLAAGVVDVKVCGIDATWSGLKCVRRVKDRQADPPRAARR